MFVEKETMSKKADRMMYDPYDWLQRRLNLLMRIKNVLEVGDVYLPVKEWSPLKCIFLSYFTGMYLRIINEQLKRRFGSMKTYYIDLFAGPGINTLKDQHLLGSPMVAIDSATSSRTTPFDKMFFVDKEKKNVDALNERLEYLCRIEGYEWVKDSCEVVLGDANDVVKDIADEIEASPKYHFLAFIDPFGMEFKWGSFECLLKLKYGDIICNYQTQLIARLWGNVREGKGPKNIIDTFNNYFGTDGWMRATNRDDLRAIYTNQLKKFRDFTEDIRIGTDEFLYHLLIAFRKTKGRNPWRNAVLRVKELIEVLGGKAVSFSIDYLSGKAKRLDDYLLNAKVEQKTMDDFL